MKKFLLLTGIISLPFSVTYSFTFVGPRDGWSSGIQIALSDISFFSLLVYLIAQRRSLSGASVTSHFKPALFFTQDWIPH